MAVIAGMYGVYHGPRGLAKIARRIHRLSGILAGGLAEIGLNPRTDHYFDTLTVDLPAEQADAVYRRAQDAGINLRREGATALGFSVNEKTGRQHVAALLAAFAGSEAVRSVEAIDQKLEPDWSAIPESLQRRSAFMEHPVFSSYQSETDMLRYLKRLENKDLSLAHAMISLGSCTMKLNATSEMIPVTWPEFSDLHPFAPAEQTQGYRALFEELERMLLACTGYDAVSLQPNAGSQGEYAGLLAIRGYHQQRGDDSDQGERHRHHDDQRLEKRFELPGHHHVDEQGHPGAGYVDENDAVAFALLVIRRGVDQAVVQADQHQDHGRCGGTDRCQAAVGQQVGKRRGGNLDPADVLSGFA